MSFGIEKCQNDVSFIVEMTNILLIERHVILLKRQNDMSFLAPDDNLYIGKTTCHFCQGMATSSIETGRLTCMTRFSDPVVDSTKKPPSGHCFHYFKSQNFHESNDFMIYDLKLLKKFKIEKPKSCS